MQAAQIAAVNEQLLKKVAAVEGEHSLAKSLLQTFYQKMAHLQSANHSLQGRVAALQKSSSGHPQVCSFRQLAFGQVTFCSK